MSKFKLTQTATEAQNILNNSLQKPTGLTKTKLVGVGVNGQENIEIGDNLTLANGKLSATGGGGEPVLHCYSIYPGQSQTFYYNVYISEDFEEFQVDKSNYIDITDPKYKPLRKGNNAEIPAVGCYKENATGTLMICSYVSIETGNNRYKINGYNIETKESYTGMLVYNYVNVIKRY